MPQSLGQVLASGGSASGLNLVFMQIAAMAAIFFMGALSIVKGYTVYRSRRWGGGVMEDSPSLEEIEQREKTEKLSFLVDELKRENERLADQNLDLHNQMCVLDTQKQAEGLLAKSNQELEKELEELRIEKEEIAKKEISPVKNSVKTKKQGTAKKNVKKEVNRKPRRVSRKGQ